MTRDRVDIEELNHDIAQSRGLDPDEVDVRARELAQELIENGEELADLIRNHELDAVFDQLARCMREFEQAAAGNPISRDACLNALSLIEKIVKAKAMEECRERAVRQLSETRYE